VALTCTLLLRDEAPGEWGVPKSLLLTIYYSGDQIKKDEIGGACAMYGGQEMCTQGFSGETAEKETTGLGVGGKIILKLIFKKYTGYKRD